MNVPARIEYLRNKLNCLSRKVCDLEDSIGEGGGGGAESDPVFTASPSYNITSPNISNWNTAFGWGNHSSAGYITSVPAQSFASLTGKPTTLSGYGITNGVASDGSYTNPAWITSIPYSKITSAPTIPTNADYVDLTTAQSVAGNKTFSGNTALASTTVTGLTPLTDNTVSLGTSSLGFQTAYSRGFFSPGTGSFGNSSTGFAIYFRQGSSSQLSGGFFASTNEFFLQAAAALPTNTGQRLQVNGTTKLGGTVDLAGNIVPSTDNTLTLGTSSFRFLTVYAANMVSIGSARYGSTSSAAINFTQGSTSQNVAGFFTTGNHYLQQSGVIPTDTGQQLQVIGTARITGKLTMTADIEFSANTQGTIYIDRGDGLKKRPVVTNNVLTFETVP